MCWYEDTSKTVVVHQTAVGYSQNDTNFNFTISNFVLKQQPSETLNLSLSIKRTNSSHNCSYSHQHVENICELILNFDNAVDEYTDYYYKVVCRVRNTQSDQHQHWFTRTELRIKKSIQIQGIKCIQSEYPITHFCFSISRSKNNSLLKNCEEQMICSTSRVLGSLFESGLYSDVNLKVGKEVFKAHKHILAESSSVFKAMFNHEMSEQKEGVVEIADIDAEVIAEMLLYIYTGKMKNISRMPIELFKAADKYELSNLTSLCQEFLVYDISCSNVVDILDLVEIYELPELKIYAEKFVACHEKEVMKEQRYRDYLIRHLNYKTVVNRLRLCTSYDIVDVKEAAFDFIKNSWRKLINNEDFLELFKTHPDLMIEIYVYMSKNLVSNSDKIVLT